MLKKEPKKGEVLLPKSKAELLFYGEQVF